MEYILEKSIDFFCITPELQKICKYYCDTCQALNQVCAIIVCVLIYFTNEHVDIEKYLNHLNIQISIGEGLANYLNHDGQEDIHIIKTLAIANSCVFLGVYNKELCVIKEILVEHGDFQISSQFIYEFMSLLEIKRNCVISKSLAKHLIFIVTPDSLRIVSEFIPLAFETIFTKSLPLNYVCEKFRELVELVDILHDKHIAHRDIKSENIRIRADGRLVLIDFDSACCRHPAASKFITRPVCTLKVRPPELLIADAEDAEKSYDAFALDVYSLGCVLYHMVTGRNFFDATNIADMLNEVYDQKIRDKKFLKLYQRSEEIGIYVKKMLSFNPAERPTVKQLLTWLKNKI